MGKNREYIPKDPFGRNQLIDPTSWRERHAGRLLLAVGGLLLGGTLLWQAAEGNDTRSDERTTEPSALSSPEPTTQTTEIAKTAASTTSTSSTTTTATTALETTTTLDPEVAECIGYYNSPQGASQKQIIIMNAERDPDIQFWPNKEEFYALKILEACRFSVKMNSGTFIR